MAQRDDVRTGRDLLVTFSREGENEHTQIVDTGENALKAAMRMLLRQDALRAGDSLTVAWHHENLIERGLA
jgi:hypothetical protein